MIRDRVASATTPTVASWGAQRPRQLDGPIYLAKRHSRFVRFLRKAVPAVGIFGPAALATPSLMSKIRMPRLPVIVAISGTRVAMEVPHIGGYTWDRRAYQGSAQTAVQDLTKPDLL